MPYKVTYEIDGIMKSETLYSYYECVCFKNELLRKGISSTMKETGTKFVELKPVTKGNKIISNWLANVNVVPKNKQRRIVEDRPMSSYMRLKQLSGEKKCN